MSKLGLENPFFWLQRNILRIIQDRLNRNVRKRDYFQILIDSYTEDSYLDGQSASGKIDFTQLKLEKKLTIDVKKKHKNEV